MVRGQAGEPAFFTTIQRMLMLLGHTQPSEHLEEIAGQGCLLDSQRLYPMYTGGLKG